jgi:cysteinyl-tRNA synthetase
MKDDDLLKNIIHLSMIRDLYLFEKNYKDADRIRKYIEDWEFEIRDLPNNKRQLFKNNELILNL